MSGIQVTKGSIVIVKEGVGIVRYVGLISEYNDDKTYIGIEIKGSDINNIKINIDINIEKYFKTRIPNRGIICSYDDIIMKLSNEMILDKLSYLYDIISGKKDNEFNEQFIHRSYYNQLLIQFREMESQQKQFDNLVLEYAILKQQIRFFKDNMNYKEQQNNELQAKIVKAEQKIGRRLSQIDLNSVLTRLDMDDEIDKQKNVTLSMMPNNYSDYLKKTKNEIRNNKGNDDENNGPQFRDHISGVNNIDSETYSDELPQSIPYDMKRMTISHSSQPLINNGKRRSTHVKVSSLDFSDNSYNNNNDNNEDEYIISKINNNNDNNDIINSNNNRHELKDDEIDQLDLDVDDEYKNDEQMPWELPFDLRKMSHSEVFRDLNDDLINNNVL